VLNPRKWGWKLRVLLSLPLLGALLFFYSCAIEPHWIEVTRHDIGQGSRELRILHLTDIHFTSAGRRERRVLEIVAEEKPDLIVLTGDNILRDFDPAGFRDFLSSLQAPLGVFACRGNWEDWVPASLDVYKSAGIRLLENASARTGDVEIIGLNTGRDPVPAGDAPLRILLCHYPMILPAAATAGVDLVFAGHTHGGQVRFPFVGALHTPFDCGPYVMGWYEEGKTRMHVSRGVGTSIFPLRFLCRPEVAIHRVRY
jgi:predicted MPP superfamily phosphohydrolase